jgi:erythronate-4-phosphate dehydrogenase
MRIVADENIPFVREAFERLGEVTTAPGRAMSPALVRDADLLLVRSVTAVNEALLAGSRVRFVGTATIGTDHVDEAYLRSCGIAFAAAPGSNANSVAEYVTAALLVLARRGGWTLAGRRIGIVGVGNVGRRVAQKARALGLGVVLNDPPLARATGDACYRPLNEALDADIVTFHVPFTADGPDATHHLVDDALLSRLRPGAVLLNTARGGVVDTQALDRALSRRRLGAVVLDVWEREPTIDAALLRRVDLGTAHIAGYSYDGKVNGTMMLYEAACRKIGSDPVFRPTLPAPPVPRVKVTEPGEDGLRQAVLAVYDIEADDAALRRLANLPVAEQGPYFDRLRKEYPVRREFMNTVVEAPTELRSALQGVGFRLT